jgi:HlyD family secretion protein
MRIADVNAAEAQLISIDSGQAIPGGAESGAAVDMRAPVTGRILRVLQQSATTLQAGTPILELGDPENDLEIVVELLSSDAVKVAPGDRVIVTDWGQDSPLSGIVERVDPWGFTKYSALGVEEQRVNAVISFDSPQEARAGLGHGFRVEVQVVVWEDTNALTVPSSALFRNAGSWAVFVEEGGRVQERALSVGRDNGLRAQILEGISAGENVVLFPPAALASGDRVKRR